MSKKVLIISTSVRNNSNSEALANAFAEGAREAGNEVETVSLQGKTIAFCKGCLACQKAGIRICEYTPLQVKQSVVGYGRAEKKQVQEMTKQLLGLSAVPKPDDTADALALALCHAHASGSAFQNIGI